jgi:glutamate/tyrosine decarboxylase-like PLP-dependent enzyme
VRDRRFLADTFGIAREAAYLPEIREERLAPVELGPEMSRRARALPVCATLAAYGRSGHRALVERNLDHAQRLAERLVASDDFELLADAPLNIVCFRYSPAGLAEDELDDLNLRLGKAVRLVLDRGELRHRQITLDADPHVSRDQADLTDYCAGSKSRRDRRLPAIKPAPAKVAWRMR